MKWSGTVAPRGDDGKQVVDIDAAAVIHIAGAVGWRRGARAPVGDDRKKIVDIDAARAIEIGDARRRDAVEDADGNVARVAHGEVGDVVAVDVADGEGVADGRRIVRPRWRGRQHAVVV